MLSEERSDEFIFATQRAVVFAETFSQPCIFFCFFSLFQDKEKNEKNDASGLPPYDFTGNQLFIN
jgi:hypothetical protein